MLFLATGKVKYKDDFGYISQSVISLVDAENEEQALIKFSQYCNGKMPVGSGGMVYDILIQPPI